MIVSWLRGAHRKTVLPVLLCAVAAGACIPGGAEGEMNRRIGIGLFPGFFILDGDYFGLKNAPGVDLRLRYELDWNVYVENRLGYFSSSADGASVGGFSYQLGLTAILPYLLPYRPVANLGFGFLSADPITVTPTETFRPSQTTFYVVVGAGIQRTIRENIAIEANGNLWATPYRYRIYRFNRSSVEAVEKQFTHVSVHVGVSYLF